MHSLQSPQSSSDNVALPSNNNCSHYHQQGDDDKEEKLLKQPFRSWQQNELARFIIAARQDSVEATNDDSKNSQNEKPPSCYSLSLMNGLRAELKVRDDRQAMILSCVVYSAINVFSAPKRVAGSPHRRRHHSMDSGSRVSAYTLMTRMMKINTILNNKEQENWAPSQVQMCGPGVFCLLQTLPLDLLDRKRTAELHDVMFRFAMNSMDASAEFEGKQTLMMMRRHHDAGASPHYTLLSCSSTTNLRRHSTGNKV